MLLKSNNDGSYTLSFLIFPEYSMIGLLSAIEPLRIANRLNKKEIFKWELLVFDQVACLGSNLFSLSPVQSIGDKKKRKIFLLVQVLIRSFI